MQHPLLVYKLTRLLSVKKIGGRCLI